MYGFISLIIKMFHFDVKHVMKQGMQSKNFPSICKIIEPRKTTRGPISGKELRTKITHYTKKKRLKVRKKQKKLQPLHIYQQLLEGATNPHLKTTTCMTSMIHLSYNFHTHNHEAIPFYKICQFVT